MSLANEVSKLLKYDLSTMEITSQYDVGKRDGIKKAMMLLDAVEMTKKCPHCYSPLCIEFSEKDKEIMMECEKFGCGYSLPLDQFGF